MIAELQRILEGTMALQADFGELVGDLLLGDGRRQHPQKNPG
jgi:hypothetical protein